MIIHHHLFRMEQTVLSTTLIVQQNVFRTVPNTHTINFTNKSWYKFFMVVCGLMETLHAINVSMSGRSIHHHDSKDKSKCMKHGIISITFALQAVHIDPWANTSKHTHMCLGWNVTGTILSTKVHVHAFT